MGGRKTNTTVCIQPNRKKSYVAPRFNVLNSEQARTELTKKVLPNDASANYSRQCREQTMTAKNRRAEVLLKLIAAADSQQPLARGVLNAILSPSRVLRNQAADRRNLHRRKEVSVGIRDGTRLSTPQFVKKNKEHRMLAQGYAPN